MKAVNVHNLKRLKKALQKQKLKRIDSYRMQVCSCDQFQIQGRPILPESEAPELIKDQNGNFMIVAYDALGNQHYRPFRLMSNTAHTSIEMHAVQKDIVLPTAASKSESGGLTAVKKGAGHLGQAVEGDKTLVGAEVKPIGQPEEEDQKEEQREAVKPIVSEAQSNLDQDELQQQQHPPQTMVTQQKINVTVESIECKDKTTEVIEKLRKIDSLYDRVRALRYELRQLHEFKSQLKARHGKEGDGFKDKSVACRKISQRLRLCSKLHKTAANQQTRQSVRNDLALLQQRVSEVKETVTNTHVQPSAMSQHLQHQAALLQQQQQLAAVHMYQQTQAQLFASKQGNQAAAAAQSTVQSQQQQQPSSKDLGPHQAT